MTQIAPAIRTGRLACRRMKQNFGIAAAYNSIAVPIAVLGFATPLAAATAIPNKIRKDASNVFWRPSSGGASDLSLVGCIGVLRPI